MNPRYLAGQHLPPPDLQPDRQYTLPEFKAYADRFNPTHELLGRHLEAGRGERTAILSEDQRLTYAQLARQADRLAGALRGRGVGEGDRVMLRAPNVLPAIVANFAVLKLGAIFIPTSPLFSRTEIAHVVNDAEVKVMLVAAPLLGEVEAARQNFRGTPQIVVIGGEAAQAAEKGFPFYTDLLKWDGPEVAPVLRDRSDVGILLYTSGTTGPPKGTCHVVEETLTVPDTFGRYGWQVRSDDVIGGSAPLAFGAGYSTFATIPYRFGSACSLIARFEPEKMFETIQQHRISILSLAPTAYRKMLQVPNAPTRYDLRSVRICTGGGESLTAETYHQWKSRFGLDIYEGFGTTEMMYVFVSNAGSPQARPGSFGRVVAGYEAKVITEDGQQAAPGEIGSLVARGPTSTLYWKDADKQRKAVWTDRDGSRWNRVGDFVHRDADSYFWFVSREDDLIKSSGYRIGPEEIEEVLSKHPAVADVGVIGVPDPVRGQNAKAFIVLKSGIAQPSAEEVIEFCRGKMAVYKLPREVEFVSELPRTPTGKLLRRVLRAKHSEVRASS
jgi:2-aminobenzoate-CoA ligase